MTKETTKTKTFKSISVKISKADFSEALELTRTLFKNNISATSVVECCVANAAKSVASATTMQLANHIVNTLKIDDCFHKNERKKASILLRTECRVYNHLKDTCKVYAKTKKLYSFDTATRTVTFTDAYRVLCKSSMQYKKRIASVLNRKALEAKQAVKKTA